MSGSFEDKYAKYYDIIYHDKDTEAECDFVEQLMNKFSSKKPKKILDMACGTGRHALIFSKRGFDVTGIDLSNNQLKVAREKASELQLNPKFFEMRMQDFKLDDKFDVALCMFEAINYITTYDEMKQALTNIRNHLKKDGLFIFDFLNGFPLLESYSPERMKIIDNGKIKMIRHKQMKLDKLKHLYEVKYNCLVLEGNKLIDQFDEFHSCRFYFPDETKHLLEECGFKVLSIFPFMEMDKQLTDDVWDVCVVCKVV